MLLQPPTFCKSLILYRSACIFLRFISLVEYDILACLKIKALEQYYLFMHVSVCIQTYYVCLTVCIWYCLCCDVQLVFSTFYEPKSKIRVAFVAYYQAKW